MYFFLQVSHDFHVAKTGHQAIALFAVFFLCDTRSIIANAVFVYYWTFAVDSRNLFGECLSHLYSIFEPGSALRPRIPLATYEAVFSVITMAKVANLSFLFSVERTASSLSKTSAIWISINPIIWEMTPMPDKDLKSFTKTSLVSK